jgi:hypothetical protein
MLIWKELKENIKLTTWHMDIDIRVKNIKENCMDGVFFGGLMVKFTKGNFSRENIMD